MAEEDIQDTVVPDSAEAEPAEGIPDEFEGAEDDVHESAVPNVSEIDPTGGLATHPRTIRVEIVSENYVKSFLGGYRNKKTGTVYHNADCQTTKPPKTIEELARETMKNHRDTQTYSTRTLSQQTKRESSTQSSRPGLYLDPSTDREVVPRPYFSSEMLDELRLRKAIIIQCHVRGWFARKTAAAMRQELHVARTYVQEEERKKQDEAAEKRRIEIQRRMHPKTTDDFRILHKELEAWRTLETKKINDASLLESERLEALAHLLHKETKLLQTIDRLKIAAAHENQESRIKTTMEQMSAPKKWAMSDGTVCLTHTPFTTRAKELLELYNGLRLPLLSIDERLDVLMHVKWTIKEFDCKLTRELAELIDREADLLHRGRSEESLQGIRQRITNGFMQFCMTPEFNPEAARFQKVPRDVAIRPDVEPVT